MVLGSPYLSAEINASTSKLIWFKFQGLSPWHIMSWLKSKTVSMDFFTSTTLIKTNFTVNMSKNTCYYWGLVEQLPLQLKLAPPHHPSHHKWVFLENTCHTNDTSYWAKEAWSLRSYSITLSSYRRSEMSWKTIFSPGRNASMFSENPSCHRTQENNPFLLAQANYLWQRPCK